jgi:hypothetical protein
VQILSLDLFEVLRTRAIEIFALGVPSYKLRLMKGTNILDPLQTLKDVGIQDKDKISFSVLGGNNSRTIENME